MLPSLININLVKYLIYFKESTCCKGSCNRGINLDFIRAQSESVHYLAYKNAKTLYYTLIKSTVTSQLSVHIHQKEVKADKKDIKDLPRFQKSLKPLKND